MCKTNSYFENFENTVNLMNTVCAMLEMMNWTTFTIATILDKSPWDSLKIWHVFANRSVFDALEGRVCAKWRPPSPLVNVAPIKCTFIPPIQHWEGEGGRGNRRGAIFSEKVQVSQHFCPGLSELNDQNKNVDNFSMIYRVAAKFGLVSLRDFVRLLRM